MSFYYKFNNESLTVPNPELRGRLHGYQYASTEEVYEYYEALKSTFPKDKVPEKQEILGEFVDRAFYAYLIASHFLPILMANDAADGAIVSDARNFMGSGRHEMGFHELPKEVLIKTVLGKGGEAGTKALSDVLQDIIDRGFICK